MYQVTAKFLVQAPDGDFARKAERFIHETVQDIVGEATGPLIIVGASAEDCREVPDATELHSK